MTIFKFQKQETSAEALNRTDVYEREYRLKARRAFEKCQPTGLMRKQFDWITGETPSAHQTLCSNGALIRAMRRRLVTTLAEWRVSNPSLNFYLGTGIHSAWETPTHAPSIDLRDMHWRARNVVRLCGFDGAIIKLEVQVVPGRKGNPAMYLPHFHFKGVVDGRKFKPRTTAKKINLSRRLSVSNNAAPLQIARVDEASLTRRLAYLIKEPYSGKSLNPYTDRYERTIEDMRGPVCLRLTEVLSHIRMDEVFFTTGCCTSLRAPILNVLQPMRQAEPFPTPRNSKAAVGNFWDEVHSQGATLLSPVAVVRTALC